MHEHKQCMMFREIMYVDAAPNDTSSILGFLLLWDDFFSWVSVYFAWYQAYFQWFLDYVLLDKILITKVLFNQN